MPLAIQATRVPSLRSQLKTRLLSLSREEGSFTRRGFPATDSPSRPHLESVVQTFIEGYNLALGAEDMTQLAELLDGSFSPAFAGFAYEGAGLYYALADLMAPGSSSRLNTFTHSAARRHDFIVTVGAGFAIARVPFGLRRLESYQRRLDPMIGWCVADGYGFHQGFFHWKRFVEGCEPVPTSLREQNRRLFDAGVGRAMWWVYGADPDSIARAIRRFPDERRAEMWTGIGTALAYAGTGTAAGASQLCDAAGPYRLDLLSGIPFAAHMRHKGGNAAEWTERVCSDLLHLSVAGTSGLISAELDNYLASWQGAESDKWDSCYMVLRDRVKHLLTKGRSEPPYSFASVKEEFEGQE